ncbi:MAG: MG2 domain-containing protein, partial [Draconibacterium sp.]|nr:MG2 domain-containing protein [Draconibacterium sp.]
EWNGKPLNIDEKGEKIIEVPGLNKFEIIETKVIQKPEQHIQIRFSDRLLKNQDLTGLVELESVSNLRLEVEGNVINGWPDKAISGELNLSVYEGIKNANYFKLRESESFLLQFSSVNPQIKLIGKGVIVAQNSTLEMPFEAVGLNAVDVRVIQIFKDNIFQFFQDNNFSGSSNLRSVGRLVYSGKIDLTPSLSGDFQDWKTYKVNLATLFEIEQGAIYSVEFRMKKEYSEYNCGEIESDNSLPETNLDEAESYQTSWDRPGWYSNYYYPAGYEWKERDNPCHVSYYNSNRSVSRNIFASQLGIIAKEGRDHKMYFAVANLLSTEPESGVKLQLYNFQKQLLKTTQTGSDGFAVVELKKKPFFLIAQKNNQFGYLRLDDGSSLSTSNFNVAGQQIRNGIKGFIYGERGVWRPGDTLFINLMLEKKRAKLPENYPVVFQLINPAGQIIEKQVQSGNDNGFYSFQPVTSSEAQTGNWRVEARAGNVSFSKRVKIEAVKPNRLKINLEFPDDILTSRNTEIPLTASWLHGTPARSLKTKVDVLFAKENTKFKGFGKYTFTNPASFYIPQEQTIFDGRLNENGETKIPLNFQSLKNAPGMLKAWFTSRVFEEGGDFSINVTSAKYAPFSTFVGVKMPSSEDNWYKTDTDYSPEIVLVDANGKPKSGDNIEAKLYKIDWRWWWESGSENLAHYVSGSYYKPVKTWKISNANHKNKLKLNIKYRTWDDNGRYLLLVKDLKSGHATGVTFYMSKWGGWRSGDSAEGATMLTLKTDKEKYNVGDIIEVKIPSSKDGRALVSIENGTNVSDIFWVKTGEKQTTFSVEAKPEMAPNFYVHVSLIQPYGQTENDAPLRLYGVIPVLVENQETILRPQIVTPVEIEPEQKYTVKVSEANNREMTYTLAIVDEGLLGLTNFRTPDPHSTFYAREALGVKTWDLYDDVAGAYGAKLEKAFAVGGDEDLKNRGKKKTSRFKPVVQFAGPFTVKKGKTNKHEFVMPNYIGAVRMMVVAGENGAYGKVDKSVPVRKGLMLLATLPRVLAPNENVQLPVNIFVLKKGIKKVTVRVKTNDLLDNSGEKEQTILFDELGEKMAYFNLKVNGKTGVAKVEIEAKSGKESATYEVELEVRNPNSQVTVEKSSMVEGQKSWTAELVVPGELGTNEAWVEISGFPPLNLAKHLDYLIRYPHGCIEQITSAAFPQLFIGNLTDLSADEKLEMEDNIRNALDKLPAFQLPNGGFGYWQGASLVNEWGTNYTGNFILQAENMGYSIPFGMKKSWLNYQKIEARNWSSEKGYKNGIYYRNYDFTQAYRLYTLALAGSPDLGAMNRLREKEEKSAEVIWRLAAAYVLAGQPEAAEKLVNNLTTEVKEYAEFGGTFGSALRDKAMILETLVLLNKKEDAFEMLKNISEDMNRKNWLSTQTAAWCLTAAANFAEKFYKGDAETKFELLVNGNKTKLRTEMPIVKIPVQLDSEGKIELEYKNSGKNANFVKVVARGIPTGIDSGSVSKNLIMNTKYFDSNNREINSAQLKQGEDFTLRVTVKHPGKRVDYEEMVLSTVFPSGWEITNRRLNDIPQNENSNFEYQDIRDDRVYTYFDLNMNQQKIFVFRLNATYKGKYYQPPVSCEAMYDFSVRAQKAGRWVEIE